MTTKFRNAVKCVSKVSCLALMAFCSLSAAAGETMTVSTTNDLALALMHMNTNHSSGDTIILKKGSYPVDSLNLPYYHLTYKVWTNAPSHIGISYFTLRGETDNPRDTVIYLENPSARTDLRMLYSYSGAVRNLTISNCTYNGNGVLSSVNSSSLFSNIVVTCCQATRGGAGYAGSWYDCHLVSNRATEIGGAFYSSNTRVYGCLIESNEAAEYGGGVYGTPLSNCVVRANRAGTHGGGADTSGIIDCVVISNSATTEGGGTYACHATNSLIACNTAQTFGGGMRNGTAVDCVVSNNVAGQSGGGTYSTDAERSRICMNLLDWNWDPNTRAYGGGVYGGVFTDCEIDGNAVVGDALNWIGGGASSATLTNCVIRNNFVYGTGMGSGIAVSSAYGCVISNNVNGASSAVSAVRQVSKAGLVNCDIFEGVVDAQGQLLNCRILNWTNGNVIAEGANVYTNGHFEGGNAAIIKSWCSLTNCLIAGNTAYAILTAGPVATARDTIAVNCTFADNRVGSYTHTAFSSPSNSFVAVNCIFSGNATKDGTPRGIYSSYRYCALTNCLVSGTIYPAMEYPPYETITGRSARFDSENAEHPYSLRYVSPGRNAGLVQDWMTGANDLRGDPRYPRLRDGLVDMGCYQCWLDPAGLFLLIR